MKEHKKKILKKTKGFFKWGVFLGCIIFLLPIVAVSAYYVASVNKIYPGVYVDNVQLGNKSLEAASDSVSDLEQTIPKEIVLSYQNRQWKLDLGEILYHVRAAETAKLAYSVGRSGDVLRDIRDVYEALREGVKIPVSYTLDEKALDSKISIISNDIFVPSIDPKIEVYNDSKTNTNSIVVSAGQEGRELERERVVPALRSKLESMDFSPTDLPVSSKRPPIASESVEKARQRAVKLLGKSINITYEDYSWILENADLVDFISFDGSYSTERIASYSAYISTSVTRNPENAAFQFSDNKVTLFRPAKDGIKLDEDKFIEKIIESLTSLEKGEVKLSFSVPVKRTPPEVSTERVNNLGIKELIGSGYSTFKGSIPGRVHNVILASSKINGTLIKPGELFSFNKALGDVSAATGYQQAYIIKEGRTVLGDGGGVCQVSTTLFRAALDAGLPIEERWAHSYRVSYYEQGGFGAGLDATVYDPSYDLKFKNDTDSYILIQSYADTSIPSLTFDLYGTKDGRVATISKPKIWSETPPPPDLYQDDPSLPVGVVKQVDFKAWGAKASFDYKVVRNGTILQDKTFYSNFSPWRAIFLKGTKT